MGYRPRPGQPRSVHDGPPYRGRCDRARRIQGADEGPPRLDLRERRWKGSGANWLRPHPTHWILLGWQKSGSSDAASVSFTGNLKVIAKDVWDAENLPRGRVPERPSSATSWGVGWERRLGELIPGSGGDRWWLVRPGDELRGIAREVIGALSRYGLPAVEHELAVAEELPRTCWHNTGGHNWFQPCGRPGDVEVEFGDRVTYRCPEHADVMREQTSPAH